MGNCAHLADMRTAEELRERVKAIRERSGLSVRGMAEHLGMSPSGYSHYEQRIKEPYLPMKIAVAISDVVAPRGVARDEVLALTVADDGLQLPSRVENGDMAPAHSDLVPVYDISASAGHGAVVDYEGVAYSLAFPPDYIRRVTRAKPADLTIISVKGDSMEPTLRDDDIVMLDMSKTSLGYEGLFVIRVYDVLHVKRLSHSGPGRVMVISDNRENYPPREYSMDEVEVVGKVIWKGGKV